MMNQWFITTMKTQVGNWIVSAKPLSYLKQKEKEYKVYRNLVIYT